MLKVCFNIICLRTSKIVLYNNIELSAVFKRESTHRVQTFAKPMMHADVSSYFTSHIGFFHCNACLDRI